MKIQSALLRKGTRRLLYEIGTRLRSIDHRRKIHELRTVWRIDTSRIAARAKEKARLEDARIVAEAGRARRVSMRPARGQP